MQWILSRRNATPLDTLCRNALPLCTEIWAAVAYVTDEKTLLEPCRKLGKKLRLWARLDSSMPVSLEILKDFLRRKSPNYELRLVEGIFHPKIIWWRGFGVYVGSANLSDSAWFRNFEAGVFLTEDDLDENEMCEELEAYFNTINEASVPLTEELVRQCEDYERDAGLNSDYHRIKKAYDVFLKKANLTPLDSLGSVNRKPASQRDRAEFLREWNETLETLRMIAERVSLPENRPSWVSPHVPAGVQADQFLHAFYYDQVGANRESVASFHKQNDANPEAALTAAIKWWRSLPTAVSGEDTHMNDWAPFLREKLQRQNLARLGQDEFAEVCARVHAIREHARQITFSALGIDSDAHDRETRVRVFGRWLWSQRNDNQQSPMKLLDFVLYGGSSDELPQRLYDARRDPLYLPHFGVSSLGEMVGWALPDKFPPRNGRTNKALHALGFNVRPG